MNNTSNKLGDMPIGRLLISMSVPMMLSFFIQALYNMVDSMFVARISEDALTAVSIALPMQQIINAIGVGTGVAVTALVPRYQGQGQKERALQIANTTVLLSICYTVIFFLVGITCVRGYYTMQTTLPTIVEAGVDYLSVICMVSIGAFFCQNFEKLLIATGNTFYSMLAQASGAIFNIIFDPLLIFGIGPFPEMGVKGAALATVLGQIFAALVAFFFLHRKEKNIRLSFRYMTPTLNMLKEIYSIGIPSIITVGLTSAMSFCLNQILLAFSTTATAVFGIWLKLQNFAFMPVFGLNNGTVPMISYNYGTGNLPRVKKTVKLALLVALGLELFLLLIFELIPVPLLGLFSASSTMLSIGIVALRICCLSLPFGAVAVILSSSFQSLGRSRYTLIVNLCRQLFFIVPIAYLMSLTGRLELIWTAAPLAELFSMLLAIILWRKMKKMLNM